MILLGHGAPDSTYVEIEGIVRDLLGQFKPFADLYGYTLISMVIPGRAGQECSFESPQYMTREIFDESLDTAECNFYYRMDLEFEKVIFDFLWLLENAGYTLHQKVFMTGFSNGGLQTNRFTFLHPELIAAAIGAAGLYMYPVVSWNGTTMNYPIGTADIDDFTLMYSFNLFKNIPHFVFVGENDVIGINDPLGTLEENAEFYRNNFGLTQASRVPIYSDYLKSIGMQSESKIYPGIGHEDTNEMKEDIFKFFESISIQE